MNAPPPLPDDLAHELYAITRTAALCKYPGLCGRITALVQNAFARQPVPETVAAFQRELAGDVAEAMAEIRDLLAGDGTGDDPLLAAKIRAIMPGPVMIAEEKLPAGDVPAASGQLAAYKWPRPSVYPHRTPGIPFETGAPWRSAAEADWDESRGDER